MQVSLSHKEHAVISFTKIGDGFPVIFLHGFLGNRNNLKGLASCLNPSLYSCYLVDMPGHGRSSYIANASYQNFVDAINLFLEEENLKESIVIGHSMGGKAALNLALQYPQKIRAVMSLDISLSSHLSQYNKILEAIDSIDYQKSLKEVRSSLEEKLEGDSPLVGFILLNLKPNEKGGVSWRIDFKKLMQDYKPMWSTSLCNENSSPYRGEASFLWGENSSFCPPDHHQRLKMYFPNSQVIKIKEAGHILHVDKLEECQEHLQNLIDRSGV